MTVFRRAVALIIAMLALLVATGPTPPAVASSYPPDEPLTVTVVNPQGPPGYPVRIVINGCIPGETIVVTLGDTTVTVNCDEGTVQAVVVINAPSVPGPYDVVVTFPDRTDGPTLTSPIEVIAGATAPATTTPAVTPRPLPRTGSNSFGTGWFAAGLLVAGIGMLLVARRRGSGHGSRRLATGDSGSDRTV